MHFSFPSKSSFLLSHFTRPTSSPSPAMADTKPPFTFSPTNSPIRPKPVINKQGKSYSAFFFKSLLFALFLIVLPLIPSQAPDFVNQIILTKLWELLHLLFVGIAVAYGLFSRRNIESDIETYSTTDNTPSYVSKMFPVSSIFGDECENSCGSDEKRMMMHCWNFSQYYENSVVMAEQYKPQVPIPEGSFTDVRYDGTNVVQAWNSEYYQCEPVVVVAQPYYTVGECDEIVGYKPLGLPVRSLRSTARDLDSPNESDSSSGSRGSSKSSVKSRDRKFGDVGPSNLDQEFNDTAGSASPISWRSRSSRMEREENHGKFSDAAGSASSIPWQERSRRTEIEEDQGEFNDFAGSASPVFWQTRSRRVESEENLGNFNDVAGSASPIPWQERCRRMEIEENHEATGSSPIPWQTRCRRMESEDYHGNFVDVAGSACPIPWQERCRRMEIEENDEAAGSSPIPWQTRCRRMESEENHGNFVDVAGSACPIPWQESFRRMEIEENDEAAGSSPIPWQTRSRRMESEENHGNFIDVAGSASPIPWQERCRRMEIKDNDEAAGSSPIPWQTRSGRMESEENHGNFNEVAGSACPIPWQERCRRMEIEENHEAAGSSSPIPWQTRSRMMESEENHDSVTYAPHFRPLSNDETKFESLSSRAFQSTMSLSSHKSSYSSSGSISSDNVNLEAEEMGQKKTSYGSSSENMNLQEEDSGEKMTSHGSSPRYGKMVTREKYAAVSGPSHFRPMSVDETQFESLGSRSFHCTGSFSSRTSLFSSLDSASSENMNLPKEDLGEKKSQSSYGSSSSSSPSPPARRRNGQASLQAFHSRGYSVGSLLQDDMKSSLKDDLTGSNGKRSEVSSCQKESGLHILQSDSEKVASLTKAPSKGKSVRTRRATGLTSQTERTGDICTKRTGEKVEKMPQSDNVESAVKRREVLRKVGPDHLLKGTGKQNMDPPSSKPEVTFSSSCKRDEQAPSKNVSKEESFIELETLQLGSDEDRVSECVNDSGLDSEVDKKASEFIARFKAQIRLQKEASMERSTGLRTMKRILGDT